MAALDTNQSLTARSQLIAASIQKFPDSVVQSVSTDRHEQSMCLSGETIRLSISLRLAIDFLHVMYIKGKQMLVFNFIFDLLWTGGGSSVSSVPFLGFRELKQIDKYGHRGTRFLRSSFAWGVVFKSRCVITSPVQNS